MKTTVKINGMSCQHCVRAVDTAIRGLPDVQEVQVKIGEAVVTTEAAPNMDRIRDAVREEGFEVA